MIARVTGNLESLQDATATIVPGGAAWLALDVLLPAFVARQLIDRIGQPVTLQTYVYLQSPDQGSSFEPRLVGFLTAQERAFFDLFTTVKGIGTRKALRALAEPVPVIAAAAHRGDVKALTQLPEIGKRLAETIVVELKGKLEPYLSAEALESDIRGFTVAAAEPALSGPEEEAVEVLVRLGEIRIEAVRKVSKAAIRIRESGGAASPEGLVSAVFASR
jgi:Holliday junction DNA helicase RuvA